MAASMKHVVLIWVFATASSIRYGESSPSSSSLSSSSLSSSTCRPQSNTFIHDLQLQCPCTISFSSPIEMDGESLDRALISSQRDVYTAVLFYASWCPFSSAVKSKFAALSSMFPQIKHVMVEQSSSMPSVLSRYGIHSFPSILIVNQTARVRYHGPKDLSSFVNFYKKNTGLEPLVDVTEDKGSCSDGGHKILGLSKRNSLKEILVTEPYLIFSVLFLFLRLSLFFFPEIISRLASLWTIYKPHLNMGIFGESSQVLGRILLMMDVKRVWSKMKLCKTRNFHNGARNARVWASSLASVSLGESSSARSFASGDS
ncbi:hypothetical protein NMG60_11028399 [Bertholletia excelsa]